MLILFDIDGTLYHGDGSGWAAFFDAGRDVFGHDFTNEGVVFAGWLDPLILKALAERNHLSPEPEVLERFRRCAHIRLRERLNSGQHNIHALEGGHDLARALHRRDDCTVGLLTGNWPENGRLKLEHVGYDMNWFPVCAWGDDGATREDLPPVARQRFQEMHQGQADIDFGHTLIVGDTIHDVQCAKAHNCPCLAVATGGSTHDQLEAAGADRVVDDLTDTAGLVDWILSIGA